MDVFTVERLAGHADAVTTARYDRRGEGERWRAAAQLRILVSWRPAPANQFAQAPEYSSRSRPLKSCSHPLRGLAQ